MTAKSQAEGHPWWWNDVNTMNRIEKAMSLTVRNGIFFPEMTELDDDMYCLDEQLWAIRENLA